MREYNRIFLRKDLCSDKFFGGDQAEGGLKFCHSDSIAQRGVIPQHRRGLGQLPRGWVEARHPANHVAAQRLWRCNFHVIACPYCVGDGHHKERVSPGFTVNGLDELGIDVMLWQGVGEQLRNGGFTERGWANRGHRSRVPEITDKLRFGARVSRPDHNHERNRYVFNPFGDVDQIAQREVVSPMHVVDQDRHRSMLGKVHGKPVEAMHDTELVGGSPRTEHRLG